MNDIPRLEKANMLLFSKEMTDKDKSMKTQLMLKSHDENKLSGEKIWKKDGFFKDVTPQLNLEKVNIPENCLIYINQGFMSTVKNSEIAMYLHNFVIGQLIIAANQPKDIDNYVCLQNEVKLLSCVYEIETGKFKGIRKQMAFIVLRGDADETFLSYGFDKLKSKTLFSFSKQQIPNAFVSVAFKKHFEQIMSSDRDESSSVFYFLPSLSDRKEEINQYKNNVSLSPVDVTVDFIEKFSTVENVSFKPDLLSSSDEKDRKPQTEILYALFNHIANVSNENLERNIAHLNIAQDRQTMEWSNSKFDSSKFKLTY